MTNKLTKLIKEQREESVALFKEYRNNLITIGMNSQYLSGSVTTNQIHNAFDKFFASTHELLKAKNTTALLEEVMKMVDEHDPNVKMGRKTGSTYWGNTLRHSLQETLDSINKHDKH